MPRTNQEPTIYGSKAEGIQWINVIKEISKELYVSRHIISQIFIRDIKAAYRKNLLGYVWIIIPGLTTTAIWMFLNSQNIINVGQTPIPYPLYVLIGSTTWLFLTQSIQTPMASFVAGSSVFMKLKVSPLAFIIAGFGGLIFELALKIIILIPIFIIFDVIPPVSSILLFPMGIIGILAFGTSVGILLIPLCSLYNDVSRATGLILGFLMYLTPVVYPTPKEGWAAMLVNLNPATTLLGATRDWLTFGESTYTINFFIITIVSCVVTLFGLIILKIVMPHLVARMGM